MSAVAASGLFPIAAGPCGQSSSAGERVCIKRTHIAAAASGYTVAMDNLPSATEAERNQRRKLAFVPMWPLLGALVVLIVVFATVSR